MMDELGYHANWWDMHTPAAFVSSFPEWVENQLVIVVPTPCRMTPGLEAAIERRFAEEGARLTKRYQEDLEETDDPADLMLSWFGIDATSIDVLPDLVDGLRGNVVLVRAGSWARWERFILSVVRRARRGDFGREYSLPRFILFAPREATTRDLDGWCVRTLPEVKPREMEMFVALREQDGSNSSLEHDLRVQLIKHVSGPDPTLASYLQTLPTDVLVSPWQHLALLNSERIGYDVEPNVDKHYPFGNPSWDTGLLGVVDGKMVLSGMAIAAKDRRGQQRFRIWRAVLQVFLPFCYIETQRFREAYRAFLTAPWPRDFRNTTPETSKREFDTIRSIEELELPHIARQMTMSDIFDSDLPNYLLRLNKLRNKIAHYNAIEDWLILDVLRKVQYYRALPEIEPRLAQQGKRNVEKNAAAHIQMRITKSDS